MSTIKDVAKMAGVSPITASRALNNPSSVRPHTIAAVKAAAKKLGYEPSRVAQSLRTGKTRIITLVVDQKETYDPLSFEFATGVSEACRANGYSLLIYPSTGREHLYELLGRVDGLVLTDIPENDSLVADLHAQIPIALFGRHECITPQIDIDNIWGARLATEHLLSLGYRDIVLVTGDLDYLFLQHRAQGYLSTLSDRGISPCVVQNTFDLSGGYAAMVALSRIPEAIVCASDTIALGVLRFLHERGLRIPVVGYDSGYLTEMTMPPLTSIRQPFFLVGVRLAEAMFKYMKNGRATSELVKPELVVKDSTWPKGENGPYPIQSTDQLA